MIIRQSYVWAAVIALIAAGWMMSGQLGADIDNGTGGPVDESEKDVVAVRAVMSSAAPHFAELVIRGRTEASRTVVVRAETEGSVVSVPAEEGRRVLQGDVLCELSLNAREAEKVEAEAVMQQRRLEYDAARQLTEKGHRSETQQAAALAAFKAAQAAVERIELEIKQTKIVAPFDGVLDDRAVEVGDYIRQGDACATLVDEQPFLVVGQVSETEVSRLAVGGKGTATLITGEEFDGRLRFISKRADPATRTFRIELELPNENQNLREGITSEIRLPVESVEAHRIAPSALVLNDEGQIGVRIVDAKQTVRFAPVAVLEDDKDGIWIAGLPKTVTIITVGQDYVGEGQAVKVEFQRDGAQS